MRPRTVFLDAGGVLVVPDHAAVREALGGDRDRVRGTFGADGDLDRAHYHGVAAYDACPDDGMARWFAYLHAFARTGGAPTDDPTIERLAAAIVPSVWTRVLPGVPEALRAIARRARIVIVSNSDGTIAASLERLGVCQTGAGPGCEVHAVVDSGAVGAHKPDPRIFEIALEVAGARAEDAVHVGDSLHADVDGAAGAGIGAVHIDPYRLCARRDHDHAPSLAELATRI